MDYIHLLTMICLTGTLALSLNYVAGFGGILSVSHLSFYGIGAYSSTLLMMNYELPFLLATAIGIIITGVIAFIASFPILKLKGDSLVLVSMGFAIIIFSILLNWQDLTNGPLGISRIPAPEIFGIAIESKGAFLILAAITLFFTIAILRWITRSVYGVIIKSIREEETKAMTVGYNTQSYKRSIFVFSALFAALAGSIFATYITVIEPKTFDLMPSVILLIMVILGGLGSLRGAILGAIFLVMMPEILRYFGLPDSIMAQVQQIIYGGFVVVLMFFRPQGLIGEYKI